MKLIIAACLLVLTIASTECKQDKRQFEDNICIDATDPTSELFANACVADFSSGSSLACEGNCRSLLDQYADECLLDGADVFKTNVENFCDTDMDPSLLHLMYALNQPILTLKSSFAFWSMLNCHPLHVIKNADSN